jgi:hypothetical protein
MKIIDINEFAEKLFRLSEGDSIDFTFGIDKNECSFGATKIKRFDAVLIIIAAYGGNESFLFDITDRKEASELCEQLRSDLQEYLGDYLYINDTGTNRPKIDSAVFQERINELRKEIIDSIIALLKSNGRQRLELSELLTCPAFVLWHEPQQDVFYSTTVFAVAIHKNSISLEVEESENEFMETLYSERGDLACMHLDWLLDLRDNITETFELQQNGD